MIHLRIIIEPEISPGVRYFPETVYICPECGAIGFFYSIPPTCCKECNETIPNLRKLKEDLNARKKYYIGN